MSQSICFCKQEAQLLLRDHAMRNVSSNLNVNRNPNPNDFIPKRKIPKPKSLNVI